MIAVIFEALPAAGRRDTYFDLAAGLRDTLEQSDGFLSVEWFESLTVPGKILSLSFFRDLEAVRDWRHQSAHRAAQDAGRGGILAQYRLRVATVLRDYGPSERDQAPTDANPAQNRP